MVLDLNASEQLGTHLNESLKRASCPLNQGGFSRSCSWMAHLYGRGYSKAPFFFVHDVGTILARGEGFFFEIREQGSNPDRERYENQLLSRLLWSPNFRACQDAVRDHGYADDLICWLLEKILDPTNESELPEIETSAVAIRSSTHLSNSEVLWLHGTSRREEELWFGRCYDQLVELYSSVALDRSVLTRSEVFVARHFRLLPNEASRMAAKQVVEIEEQLRPCPPLPPSWVQEQREVSSAMVDSGYYPQGGLDEISTRGSIENLVRSEMVYLEDEQGPDLFTLRYVEGELLYYTRDEGQLLRRSRSFVVIVDLPDELHYQYPGYPARLSSMVEALLNGLVEDLFALLDGDRVFVRMLLNGKSTARSLLEAARVRFSQRIMSEVIDVGVLEDGFKITEELTVQGLTTVVIYLGATEPPSEKERTTLKSSGLEVVWMKIEEGVEEESDSYEDPSEWFFRLPGRLEESHWTSVVDRIKRRLVWAACSSSR